MIQPWSALDRVAVLILARLLLACLIFASACGGEGGSPGALVRDSAGIAIVENQGFVWPAGQGWRLADAPALDIGVLEGEPEYQLYQVTGAVRLGDGRIVVANAGSHELRFYDPRGRFLSASGREGGGPGEFGNLTFLSSFPGDSLLVYDWRQRRLSFWDDEGNFARSASLPFLAEIGGFPIFIAPFSDATLLVAVQSFTGAGELQSGLRRDPVLYLLCDYQGAVIDTLGRFPGADSYVRADEGRVMIGSLTFGRSPQQAVSGDGFYFGAGDEYEIRYFDSSGELRRILRREQANLEVTAADIQFNRQRQLERAEDAGRRRVVERLLADMPYPETHAAYRDVVVDAEGNLWVGDVRRPGDDQPRWTVFDPSGRMLGVVEMPERFAVHQIGRDFVLGRWVDDLDVEHIRLYELIKETG